MQDQFRLTPSRDSNGDLVRERGLIVFRLGVWVDGLEVDSLAVYSGAAGKQEEHNLKLFSNPNSLPGSLEPIPEGTYKVGPVEWARYNDLYASWGSGLGPVWSDLLPFDSGNGRRSAFGFHLDENNSYAPGSAGCVVMPDRATLDKYLVLRKKFSHIKLLTVDYGLGTVPSPAPPVKQKQKHKDFKMFVNDKGVGIVIDGKKYSMFSDSNGWSGKLVPME